MNPSLRTFLFASLNGVAHLAFTLFLAPSATAQQQVDASTLHRKTLVGYQGWFRCPGDPAGSRWKHWSRDGGRLAPDTLTFEMWPDLTGFGDDEKFPAPGFVHADGSPAHLFSSAHPNTVRRHFEWMRDYGIDGAFVQRVLVELRDPSFDKVLEHVRASARETGRAYAVCYDLSSARPDRIFDTLAADWKRLVDEKKLTADDHYLRHNDKPVLFVWGFFSDRFGPDVAHRLIDFLKDDPKYGVTLVGGCPWHWRGEKDAAWARAYRRFDMISPWNVGNTMQSDGQKHANTGYWNDDVAEAKKAGMQWLPVLYPGFGWTNLKGPDAAGQSIPRLGGEFFWRQFSTAADLGVDMAYVAMFDEVDEGTAILKVTNDPPTQANFQTYEGLPADWYLRLTGEGAKLIRGDRKNQRELPVSR